ncbi:hypothetical protein ACLKA7_011888 [Drosophila subpalustris]
MEASKRQNKSRIELFDNEERVKLIEDVQQILWDLTDKKQKSKARYKRRRSNRGSCGSNITIIALVVIIIIRCRCRRTLNASQTQVRKHQSSLLDYQIPCIKS